MALNQDQAETVLDVAGRGALYENVSVGRHIIDGAVVVYDLDDPPAWLKLVELVADEDGNTPADVMWECRGQGAGNLLGAVGEATIGG